MEASSAKAARNASRPVRSATSMTTATIAQTKILVCVVHRVHSRPTRVGGKKENPTTSIGQGSMVVRQEAERVMMPLGTLQVW